MKARERRLKLTPFRTDSGLVVCIPATARSFREQHEPFFSIYLLAGCLLILGWQQNTTPEYKVSLGGIFRGQTGHVWTKGISLLVEVVNSARDEQGDALPVVVSGNGIPAHTTRFEENFVADTPSTLHTSFVRTTSSYYAFVPYSGSK